MKMTGCYRNHHRNARAIWTTMAVGFVSGWIACAPNEHYVRDEVAPLAEGDLRCPQAQIVTKCMDAKCYTVDVTGCSQRMRYTYGKAGWVLVSPMVSSVGPLVAGAQGQQQYPVQPGYQQQPTYPAQQPDYTQQPTYNPQPQPVSPAETSPAPGYSPQAQGSFPPSAAPAPTPDYPPPAVPAPSLSRQSEIGQGPASRHKEIRHLVGVHGKFGGGVGGDSLVKAKFSDGHTEELTAGGGMYVSGGLSLTPLWIADAVGLGIGLDLNYQGDSIEAQNGSVTFDRYGGLLSAHILVHLWKTSGQMPVGFYLLGAGGLQYVASSKVSGAISGNGLSGDLGKAKGGVAEIGLDCLGLWKSFGISATVLYTKITYSPIGGTIDGSGVAMVVGFHWDPWTTAVSERPGAADAAEIN
jgi:hypothetical protein